MMDEPAMNGPQGPAQARPARADAAGLLQIGDFARAANTNLRTLRYYEELGLLLPAHKSKGGFRFYRHTDVNRLRMVQTLQDLGLRLERIGELMATREEGLARGEFLARVRHALEQQDELLVERRNAIDDQRQRIRMALDKLFECKPCARKPSAANNFCEPCELDGRPLPEDLSALY